MSRPAGVYSDVSEAVYHADRSSLSQSGAKLLLPPSCPAKFKQAQDWPPKSKPEYDFGHLVHKLVLGKGADIVVVAANDWRTKAAKEERDQAHRDGRVPVLASQMRKAERMRDAVTDHPLAGRIFRDGQAEVSLYVDDRALGVRLRGRFDWLTDGNAIDLGSRLLIVDYKTSAEDVSPKAWARKAFNLYYHLQFAWYVTLARLLDLDADPIFLHVAQETDPPHLVSVNELDADAYKLGREQMAQAIAIFQECTASDIWPGYPAGIQSISLPPWAFSAAAPTISDLLTIT